MRSVPGGVIDRCGRCGMHAPICLCNDVEQLTIATRVVVVSNGRELRKSSNSARLAALTIAGAEVRCRGVRDAPLDLSDVAAPTDGSTPLLLYPADGASTLAQRSGPVTLIVPDGNWRQARKVAMRERALAGVERVTLPPGPPSRYRLRTHPDPARISTYEAIARAVGILEGAAAQAALLRSFEMMVERVLWTRGKLAASEMTTGLPRDAQAQYDARSRRRDS